MRKMLQDDVLQEEFLANGYVIIPDFLNQEEIEYLTKSYHSLDSDLNQGFHATLHSAKVDYRQKVSALISEVFTPKATEVMNNYQPVFANYTVKEPDEKSGFDLHLDWTMVDEKRFSSVTFWCPLIDINDQNGCLWVLKGSHKFEYTIRGGPGLHTYVASKFSDIPPVKYERVVNKLSAGSVLIYDHRLIHGSPPNQTNKPRVAINYTMIPDETKSWHYHFRGDRKVEIMEVEPEFYNRHILNTEPTGVKSLGCIDIEPNFLSQEEMNQLSLN